MAYHLPDTKGLQEIGQQFGMRLTEAQAQAYHAVLDKNTAILRALEELPDEKPRVRYPRTPGWRPDTDQNPYRAWYVKTDIAGAAHGKLHGKTLAIKDNICVAGVPMSNGASTLEGFVPDVDASVVERVLDAGGRILGKAACEYFCNASNSATCATGAVENPRAPGRSTGGSSNGCAALVAAGEVDMAIGADQGGSIRMPASFCGIVGLKPTYGLVPYTGASGMEYSLDHLGPMTRTVADCALLLEVLAGDDGIDGRQRGQPAQAYSEALGKSVRGLRIGVVSEGFGRPESEAGVDDCVREAIQKLQAQGAMVESVSIPWHNTGSQMFVVVGMGGVGYAWAYGHGVGYGVNGAYPLSFMKAFDGWKNDADALAPTVKATLLMSEVLYQQGGQLYAKMRNLTRKLRAEYDAKLAGYDVLVMPTTPMTATPLTSREASIEEVMHRSWEALGNTCPFDLTGHPAISVCCGQNQSRPVGLMIVAAHWQESVVLQVANAVHQQPD